MGMWNKIFDALSADGFNVFPPDTKVGYIDDMYIVVKLGEKLPILSISSSQNIYYLYIYFDKNNFSVIEEKLRNIENSMDKLFPTIRTTNNVTEPFWDDSVKAYIVTMTYINVSKNKRRNI